MKVGLGYRGRLRGDLGAAGQEIDLTHQALREWQESEHTVEGGHTDITAETLEVEGLTSFGGRWLMPRSAVLTPPYTITANQNDYAPRDLDKAIWLRVTTDASRNFTGLKTDKDEFRWAVWTNVGNFDHVFKHNDTASMSIYRFACPLSADVTVGSGGSLIFLYDAQSANWRIIAYAGGVSGVSSGGVPLAHASSHENGGSDEISVAGLSGQLADAQLVGVRKNSTGSVFTRSRLNFIEGSNVTLTVADDGTEVDVTIASSGGGGGLSDADYGDITVSSSGTVITIDNDVVTYAKMQDISATQRVLGRNTSGAGDTEEVTLTQLLDWSGE